MLYVWLGDYMTKYELLGGNFDGRSGGWFAYACVDLALCGKVRFFERLPWIRSFVGLGMILTVFDDLFSQCIYILFKGDIKTQLLYPYTYLICCSFWYWLLSCIAMASHTLIFFLLTWLPPTAILLLTLLLLIGTGRGRGLNLSCGLILMLQSDPILTFWCGLYSYIHIC